ncbi:hypothetical protein J3E71DRAFT_348349 [Bipolaris maydis]|nr:hypothetical protein J3E71DRAFT_348349 [Bipolaris maydis]
MSESRILLSQLADLAQRHRRNPYMPGTLEKFASLVPELHSMADSLASPVRISEPKTESHEPLLQPALPTQPLTQPPTHFMDFTINNMSEWNWHDMSSLLGDGVSGVPNIPGDSHVHGPQSTGPN